MTYPVQLGAVRFDRDLRAIIGYLASQITFGDIREKFLRLQQISTLLNLDAVGFMHLIKLATFLLFEG